MSDITYANKDKNGASPEKKWRDVDANEVKTAVNSKVDKVSGKGLSTEDYSSAEKTKLSGIATGATANDTDANLKNRSNHTGTQLASTISDFNTAASSAAPAETVTTEGALINGATEKTTPVDADFIGLMDSAASNVLKKLSWANVKATLKTYFDAIYATIANITALKGVWKIVTVSSNAATMNFNNENSIKYKIGSVTANTALTFTAVEAQSTGIMRFTKGTSKDVDVTPATGTYTFVDANGDSLPSFPLVGASGAKIDIPFTVDGTVITIYSYALAERSVALTGTVIDWNLASHFYTTLSANTTFTFTNQGSRRNTIQVRVVQSAGQTFTATWPTTDWGSAGTPGMRAGGGSGIRDIFTFSHQNSLVDGAVRA